ncbi:MAG: Alcohol dehydrogenase zinc-binding domain protein [Frankiales bacterium]|nr:Alcohol dehydrogenase zinc-binding domain protein [Frankiales bacterium]
MLAVTCTSQSADDPLSGLTVGERPAPEVPEGWVRVTVKAAALNHHDLWSLKGVGLSPDLLPMTLGCDAAGTLDDGTEVVVHAVVSTPGWAGDETLDPKRTLLSEKHQGTLSEVLVVPERNVLPKPPELSWEDAACLPTAWLTAYRMLFTHAGLRPGQTVLVQGAGGGVATAAIALARHAGYRVWATSRDEGKRKQALDLGAHDVFETGARLPERVDAVLETVGKATWSHSMKALRPGGTLVVSGATTGADPGADLNRLFFLQLRVIGSTMGTRDELKDLLSFCVSTGLRPVVSDVRPLSDAATSFAKLAGGDVFGKLVLTA